MEAGSRPTLPVLFERIIELEAQIKNLKRSVDRIKNHPTLYPKMSTCEKPLLKFFIVCLLVLAAIVAYSVTQTKQYSSLKTLASSSAELTDLVQDAGYQVILKADAKQEYEDCSGPDLKQAFPDLDYAFLGYNILKGFPLAVGSDPGFTYPIFRADYSSGYQSADCRYSVPSGLVVLPDITCITTFSSTAIQNKYEFSQALSKFTKKEEIRWGRMFSASTKYKRSSSEIASTESTYILSTANCNYYISKLVTEGAPKFDDVFMKWVHKLNSVGLNPGVYFSFFETYGTHFATEVTFGARYTYEFKMSSRYYEIQQKKGVNLKKYAGFLALFAFGGVGKGTSKSKEEMIKEFSKNVEIKTISVGAAPPENGSALVWASEVKANPVPTAYELSSIEELFTERYMKTIAVDYNRIRTNIIDLKMEYCLFLQKKGKVETCESLAAGIELKNTRLSVHYRESPASTISDCVDMCLEEIQCEAISFCINCPDNNINHKTCHLLNGENGKILMARQTEAPGFLWQSIVFPEKIDSEIKLTNVSVIGMARGFEKEGDKTADLVKCKELCIQDAYCSAYSFCDCQDQVSKCKMFSMKLIIGLKSAAKIDTYFISSRLNTLETSTREATTVK